MPIPFASILFDNAWLTPAVVALAVVALFVLYCYARAFWPTRLRWIAGLLKIVGIALLLSCLIEPLWSGTRAKPGENLFLVAVDRSASLQVRGEGARHSRGAQLEELLGNEESGWAVRLAQDFEVRRYTFDARLEAVDSYRGMTFDGTASALLHALRTLADRFVDRPVAGILLFTDGNATDWSPDAAGLLYADLPHVYPVIIDSREAPTDVSIENVAVSETSFEDAPVTLRADVRIAGERDEEIVCRLLTLDGALVEEQRRTPVDDTPVLTFRFQVRPTEAGLSFYQLRAGSEDEIDAFEEPSGSEEATLANNQRLIAVDREEGPHRVLYVGGRPNWDFKFLRRSLEDDHEVELVGLIRIARREAKFDFRGRAGESGNSLFRGFNDGDDETEAYDEPVIVRLSTRDERELKDGFPETKEELYEYDAIILDDVEAGFFKHEQLSLIEGFVSERGGGLLMLGGADTFEGGGYDNTPLEDVLPVYVDRAVPAQPQQYRLELSREGWLEPWVRLRTTEPEEETRLVEMPGFTTLTRVRNLKPAARELAHVRDELGERHPALVVQQYGDGRSGALLLGDVWRWSLRRDPDQPEDPEKAWRQTIRWLVADIPQRVAARIERTEAGESSAMRIRVTAHDAVYGPLENAAVTVTIESPDGESLVLDAEPSTTVPGLFETIYVPREPGVYRAEAVAVDADGLEAGRDDVGWTSDPAATEFHAIEVNRNLLREIADATGGELIELEELPEFVESLPYRTVPETEQWTSPLWHHPWVLLLAIGCLAGEWGLRRLKGLP